MKKKKLKMADEVWNLKEDGYLNLDIDCNSIAYHPNLNVIILLTKSSEVLVIDVNSGLLLQRTFLSANHNGRLQGTYLPEYDKIFFADDKGVGVRNDYNGVLLLDTILQTPVAKGEEVVKLELLISEAILLQRTLKSVDLLGVEQTAEVLEELNTKITEAQARPKKGIKAQKWITVCLELPHCSLKWVCLGLVTELKRQNRHVPALAIASAVNERLNSLLPMPHDVSPFDRSLMFSEAMRRLTFTKWPHMNYKWALPDQMAQAGFYHQPNSTGDDRAMCFTCIVCLVCWEPTDEPWSEHERHSPSCPFVKGEYTQNVPLSVTYATAPAITTDGLVEVLGTSSVPELLPTCTNEGHITIWNCSRQLKSEANLSVRSKTNIYNDIVRRREAWSEQEIVEIPLSDATLESLVGVCNCQDVKVSSVSVVKVHKPKLIKKSPLDEKEEESQDLGSSVRPALVAGVTVLNKGKGVGMSPLVKAMNDVNQASSGQPILDIMKVAENRKIDRQLYLVVYDFHYRVCDDERGGGGGGSGGGSGASKTQVSGTGTSAARQDNNMYQDIFLSKFLCQGPMPMLHDVEGNVVVPPPECLVDGLAFPATSSSSGMNYQAVPLGVAVPTAGGGTFDTSMAINEGLDMTNFPSTSNGSPPQTNKLMTRESKSDTLSELSSGMDISCSIITKEPVSVQTLLIDTNGRELIISGLYPTKDGRHLLVVLTSCEGERTGGMLLVYKLNEDGVVVRLNENPVCVKVFDSKEQDTLSVTMFPLSEKEENSNINGPMGVAVVVTFNGNFSILDISTLEIIASVQPPDGNRFVAATFCNSLERVCAATDKGSLHFYALRDEDETRFDEDCSGTASSSFDNIQPSMSRSSSSRDASDIVLVNSPRLALEELRLLYDLTRFENLIPCYSATVPACWTELMQAQKQRRYPQHLQHAEDAHHTRSWRLQNDSTTWDEHVFELTLPRSVSVGHIDVKFSLHSQCPYPPHIEVTLLKQNTTGIGRAKEKKFQDVDSFVEFNIPSDSQAKKGAAENPVITEEYAVTHNTEVICGPINLASCLDLSDQSGTITFSSPKLFRVKGRTFLIHMKALADPANPTGLEKGKRGRSTSEGMLWDYASLTPGSAVERLASNVVNKKMEYLGCDWLHEVSVTIRKTKQTDIPNERNERCAMLESDNLVDRLVSVIVEGEGVRQNIALDILIWIAVIRLGRHRVAQGDVTSQQHALIQIIETHLGSLIYSCFIKGARTVAHKCVKLFVICSEGMKNVMDSGTIEFDTTLLGKLLEMLPQTQQCWSSGALRWYFTLLSRYIALDTVGAAAHKALNLLKQVARHLHSRQNPYHLILQTRFGLYGTPFQAELFDLDPPVAAKFTSTPVTYATVVANDSAWGGVMTVAGGSSTSSGITSQPWLGLTEPLDLRELLTISCGTSNNTDIKNVMSHTCLKGSPANHYMKGLLEVEPLHFTCHATSDGTKLEKLDSGSGSGSLINFFDTATIPLTPVTPIAGTNNGPKNTQETEDESQGTLAWQHLVVAPPHHILVIERMHSGARRFVVLDLGAPVLLTDLIVPACSELLSLSIDFWCRSEEVDAQRLVVAPDISSKTLIMSDIQPPPIARYLKITTIGRYGMNTTKCKIPIGSFYGHILVFPGEDYAEKNQVSPLSPMNFQNQLSVLSALFEDIQCRYSLASTKLQDLLTPLLTSEIPNIEHMHHYLRRGSNPLNKFNTVTSQETPKIISAYQECVTYQHQLNTVRSVISRLGGGSLTSTTTDTQHSLATACTDKLRVLAECLLDLMLYLVYEIGFIPRQIPMSLYQSFDQSLCERLFHWLCVNEDTRTQLSACTLLVRMCGLQPWWGDFIVSTLTQLYSSQQTNIFPQDRIFILLVYLGRKALCGGASRSTIMDSVLKTLLKQLSPLTSQQHISGFLRSNMDLALIGWLLLFLSQCLDSNNTSTTSTNDDNHEKKNYKEQAGHSSRWDFLQGELSMQKRMGAVGRSSASRNYRRKLQKKLMHHKQQLEDLEVAKKAFQASTQALSALSNQAAKLSYKLETALKQQEQFLKKTVKQQQSSTKQPKDSFEGQSRFFKENGNEEGADAGASTSKRSSSVTKENDNNVLCLPRAHCLAVSRALITLILHMDFTCNLDMFLLACKVVARVAVWTKPTLSLGEVMSEEQLSQLLRIAVWNDQKRSAWGGSPWACHAITCLLQDILEGVRNQNASDVPNNTDVELEQSKEIREEDVPSMSNILEQEEETTPVTEESSAAGPSSMKSGANFALPALLESDDSELEDLLDDILERGRTLMKKTPVNRIPIGVSSNVSTALDSRLEYGVEGNVEVLIRRMTAQGAYNLPVSVSATISVNTETARLVPPAHWEEDLLSPWETPWQNQDTSSSVDMLKDCFEKLFVEPKLKMVSSNLELVLQLWLTINQEPGTCNTSNGESGHGFDASLVPTVALSPASVSALMSCLAWKFGISVRDWCLAFQTLTLVANLPSEQVVDLPAHLQLDDSIQGMAHHIVNDVNFLPMLQAFLSSSQIKGYAGVFVCQCLHELLVRLEMRCDVVSGSSNLGKLLKDLLLKLVLILVKPGGAITLQQGPIDGQTKLIQLMLLLNFANADISTAISILESVGSLVQSYMMSGESIKWRNMLDPVPAFSASMSPGGTSSNISSTTTNNKQPRPASWDHLVISIMRLVINLVQTPLEEVYNDPGQGTSQTDEHKAANHRTDSIKHPCVADIVLQHEPTMLCLLSALGSCNDSSLILHLLPEYRLFSEHGEPTSIGEAVFQLLSMLAYKATMPKFILKPLFIYLSGNYARLSEPLLSLVLRVLDSEKSLEKFTTMDGLNVVCRNFVVSNLQLINCRPSTVSVVMQHFFWGLAHGSLPPQSPPHKKCNSPVESCGGLLNFAPLGSISSRNPTAQPSDVLIQSAAPHRRARAPAWSYNFFPDETWVELTLTLPCAILLKEVHLQPHLTTLATCPSGVGVEISRDGRSALVPISPPLDTSGLTFIRLVLPQAEVVTTVLLRLYKPKDSTSIGLSQIRLLGSTTFSDTASSNLDNEDRVIQSSFGWLRLLHHCITVASESSNELKNSVISAAATTDGLLEACCGLLLVPAPVFITPCLERVLLVLGLHDSQLGLKMIDTLLNNGASPFHQAGLSNAVNSVMDLLFLLCSTHDGATKLRVNALLTWLHSTAASGLKGPQPSSAYVHCAAAILWAGHENGSNFELADMVTPDLFSTLYTWTLSLQPQSVLKRAIDTVLCAMCYIKPVLFQTLLQKMGVLVPIRATGPAASISDDRKDPETTCLTDDSKELELEDSTEWYDRLVLQDLQSLVLSESQLMTVAMSCQSPPATLQLLDSGLPSLLTQAILELCTRKRQHKKKSSHHDNQSSMTDADKASGRNHVITGLQDGKPMIHLKTMPVILQFFAEVCSEGLMRDWLGSPEGSIFWLPLLQFLCCRQSDTLKCELISDSFSTLEAAAVKFFSRCCWCHPSNQKLLANVLCEVIGQQKSSHGEQGISGVTRRLVLQLLLESEKMIVCVRGSSPNFNQRSHNISNKNPVHPSYGVGHGTQLHYISIHSTLADVLKLVAAPNSGQILETKTVENGNTKDGPREPLWWELNEQLAVAAGVTAKDKRTKDVKNANLVRNLNGKKSFSCSTPILSNSGQEFSFRNNIVQYSFQHQALPGVNLPPSLTISQILKLIQERDFSLSTPCIKLVLTQIPNNNNIENGACFDENAALLSSQGLPTPLQVFTQQGGLALLAQHLPLVYPETLLYFGTSDHSAPSNTPQADLVDAEWVKVDANVDIYEDMDENMASVTTSGGLGSGSGGRSGEGISKVATPTVPLHSLAAFGLFLRLPGYADVLLKDKQKAQCLLRLVLGVTDDGEGGDILSCPVASSLPTLPFEVLRQLFQSTPLSTDDGVFLRRTALEVGALHLLLACLAVFTHQPQDIHLPGVQNQMVVAVTKVSSSDSRSKSDDKSHLYWAKGTGFGTGSTTQSWNVEQALSRQRSEEEHVTVLLLVLSSYINPGGLRPCRFITVEDSESMDTQADPPPQPLPPCIHGLLLQSCLLPALASYLRNDSVLDMARHIPLYRSVLQLLRAIAQNSQLVSLLLPQNRAKHKEVNIANTDNLSVVSLLTKMNTCVDTYATRLRINKHKGHKKIVRVSASKQQDDIDSDEGLAFLIPDIQDTASLVQMATDKLVYETETEEGISQGDLEFPLRKSLEERYLEVMKSLQFDTYEMISESSDGNGYQFVVSYHFESNVRASGDRSHPARVKRLAQETVTLSTSLPLSYSSSVFVRCDADRLDIMKVLITGPAETPYANGCFELDVYFPSDYPNSPMLINLETTGRHTIRFNPNLYNDGKVCLSVLNTWHGRPEEKWNAHTSSFLQVLVSIQSLILVPEPYFNEPGYERSRGTQAGNQSSREYNSNICQATVKWAMLEQLRNPSPCFKEVIQTHFWMKRKEIKTQIESWIADMESQAADRRHGRTISLNTMALKRHYQQLCEELIKLKPPPGLEDLADLEPEVNICSPSQNWSESDIDMEKMVSQVCE